MIAAFLTFAVSVSLAQPAGPLAPAFNPALDAPHTVGQPGHLAPDPLPRSPHKRVLPPEKGPGIWAGDEPKPSDAPEIDRLLHLPIPSSEHPEADRVLSECATLAEISLPKASLLARSILRLTDAERNCVSARTLAACAEQAAKNEAAQRRVDEMRHVAAERAAAHAHNLAEGVCSGLTHPGVNELAEEWHRLNWTSMKGRGKVQ
jgi:hypothetical protein